MSSQSTIVTYLLASLAAVALEAEPPGFQTHVIAAKLRGMINLAAWDTAGDGIQYPRESWSITEIERLPATHRMRLADIYGNGQKVLASSPLAAADTEPPDYRGHVPLVFYRPGEGKRQLIDDSGREGLLIAGFTGVRLYKLDTDGNWKHTEILKGRADPWLKSGASEVAVGRMGKGRFPVAVEPLVPATTYLNGDYKTDIVCVGMATNNLKWYENLGPAKSTPR